jgi:hypothetical protein
MSRPKRIHIPGGFYFVSTASNPGNQLSRRSSDDWEYLSREVNDALNCFGAWAHAFCWTPARLYLCIQVGSVPLGRIMQRFKSNFSHYQNEKIRTKGNWFEQRYQAMLLDEHTYFRQVARHIHLQPLSLALVKDLNDYPWCSHNDYLGRSSFPRLKTDYALSPFDPDISKARPAYDRFVKAPLQRKGPLVNTLPPCTALDRRILGSYELSQKVLGRYAGNTGRPQKTSLLVVQN